MGSGVRVVSVNLRCASVVDIGVGRRIRTSIAPVVRTVEPIARGDVNPRGARSPSRRDVNHEGQNREEAD